MFKETIIYIIMTSIILFISYLFDILLEMSLFIIYYYFIKNLFTKQFHADCLVKSAATAVKLCFTITFITQLIFIFILVKFELSYYINIYIGVMLGILSYIVSDWSEKFTMDRRLLCNEEVLIKACQEAHISKIATNRLVLKYIKGVTIKEIALMENVEEDAIKQSLRRSRRKLNLKAE